jgi:inner membrane protein
VDNLTHALAGMLVAEAAVQLRSDGGKVPARAASGSSSLSAVSWRSAAYVVSVAGNNLPDLDFLWSGITARPFGYLLHHRGHSHTVPGALVGALLLAGAVIAFTHWRRAAWSRSDYCSMFALCLAGPLAHIAMDSSNNYGVHPFWPLYRGWIYGDAVFIVEPFFWAAGLPPLVFAARSAITRSALLAFLALGVGSTFFVRFVPAPMALLLALLALGCAGAAWRASPPFRALFGVGLCLAVAASFFAASRTAVSAVRSALGHESELFDVVVTPMPANPLCFMVLTVERHGGDYVARRATVATWPALFPHSSCPDTEERATASFAPSSAADTAHVRWRGDYVAPFSRLAALYRDNCQAAALLRFFRVPYWVDGDDGTLIFGDLRYDRSPGLDFSDARIERWPTSCPSAVPSWTPPRHDLLDVE